MTRPSQLVIAVILGATAVLGIVADAEATGTHCKVITHRALLDGTENQPAGITAAAPYGWAEIDAAVTADGAIVASHDARLGRLTGGASTAYISEVTHADLLALPHPYGPFQATTDLIATAATLDTPIMVTINRWGAIRRAGYADATLDTLYAAAQDHPRPHVVYFGGFGPQDAMRERHPDAATFWRYEGTDTRAHIRANIAAEDIDLVALPPAHYAARLVHDIRGLGARVTTRQIRGPDRTRDAQAAGITTIQGNNPERIATEWCR